LRLAEVDPRRARAEAEWVRAEAARAGDDLAAAQAERALGMAARAEQDVVSAAKHLCRAVRPAKRAGAADLAAHIRISRSLALAYAGRMAAAHAELDRAAEVLAGADLARVELQRAAILQLEGRLDEADERLSTALPLLTRAGDLEALAVLHNNRGMLRSWHGHFARAAADLRQAVALHRQLGHEAAAAQASQNLGLLAAWRGDLLTALAAFDEVDQMLDPAGTVDAVGLLDRSEALLAGRLLVEARAVAERAVAEQEQRHLSAYLDQARLVLARIALYEGRFAEARTLAEQSAQAFSRQRRPSYRALADEVAIHATWRAGERTPALLAASRRTDAALERSGWTVAAADARLLAAQVAMALGRSAAARAELARLTQPRRADPADLRSRAFYARALLHLIEGDRSRANMALRAGIAVVERQRHDLGGTDLRAYASAHAADLATLGLRLAAEDGNAPRVLQWAERWRASTLSMPPIRPPQEEKMSEALAELRLLLRTGADPDGADRRPKGVGDGPAARRHRQAALERTIRRLARRSTAPTRNEPQRTSTAEIRAALGERALVELVDVAGTLHAVVVTERGLRLHKLCPTMVASRLLIAHRFWLRRLVHQYDARTLEQTAAAAAAAAQQLDEVLLQPLRHDIDDRPLVIIPTATLHTLAWTALPTARDRPVTVAPSAGWWHHAARLGPADPGHTILISGPDLPHGPAEIDTLRTIYPDATALTGSIATVHSVVNTLDGAALAHIAAHSRLRTDQPMLSSLRLADGPMFVYDLQQLDSAPRILVLASCDAGLTGVLPGDELTGMATAMLALGTTALVSPPADTRR